MIVAVDTVPAKREAARRFGATDVVDGAASDVVEQVRALTAGGADFAFDAVGAQACLRLVVDVLADRGTATLVGIPAEGARLDLDANDTFGRGLSLRVCHGGSCDPAVFLPELAQRYLDGTLELDAMVSRRIGLDDVEDAFRAMQAGEVIRSVVCLEA
jgi:Zn-dependent alcohol dehydrogenase